VKEVMNTNDVTTKDVVESTVVDAMVETNSNLKALIEEICVEEEFSILRETLRLYVEEMGVH
jgi:hypothetical protein